jgi:hypothetical protein
MGAVLLAQRTDGEVEQRVAIKVVRDAAGPAFRDRFPRERQILASNSDRCPCPGSGSSGEAAPFSAGLRCDLLCTSQSCDPSQFEAVEYPGRLQRSAQAARLGIARILDETDRSKIRERLLSPDQASPQQVRGAPLRPTFTPWQLCCTRCSRADLRTYPRMAMRSRSKCSSV